MMAKRTWRCFHCDDVFTRAVDAAEHFGGTMATLAGCQIKGSDGNLLGMIREQEAQLARYRNDDSDIMRAMAALHCEHATAIRRAEEDGYGRAVREMQALALQQLGSEVFL